MKHRGTKILSLLLSLTLVLGMLPGMSLTAYAVVPYTLVYDAGDGTGSMASTVVNEGDIFTFPECTFIAPQYKKFDHWKMSGVDGIFYPDDQNNNSVKIVANCADTNGVIIVTAYWGFAEPASVTTAPGAKDLSYDGTEQKLVTAGMAEGGTMQYALGTATEATEPYAASIPTATDVGTYYVWYKAKGDASHSDYVCPQPVVSTISINTYTVTVNPTQNGTVTASKTTAAAGESITLTITPASGYQVQAATATDANGNAVPVTNNSFTMPAADVTVTVTFIESPATTYTVSFAPNGGGGYMAPVTVAANTSYTLPASGFTAPAGKEFDCWYLGTTRFAPGDSIVVDRSAEFTALWKDKREQGGEILIHGNIPGGFGGGGEWNDGSYVTGQRAWKVSLAPITNGSAALGIMSGESTTTDMNVYPNTSVYVFPNPDPGYRLDKIIWSLIDGSASYDITEAKNFVMPAMDAVVYVTFRPAG